MNYAYDKVSTSMENEKTIISFFFNARGVDLEKSATGLYRSLLATLLVSRPELQSVLELGYSSGEDDLSRFKWTIESLTLILREAMKGLGDMPLMFLIDGLDECEGQQIRDMVSFFEGVSKLVRASGSRFYLFLASRHYPHITIDRGIEIVLDGQEGHCQDIARYLSDNLRIQPPGLCKAIQSEVQQKGVGNFYVGRARRPHPEPGTRPWTYS